MPATASRIGFITQEFRVATVENTGSIPAKYGSLARKTDEPVETMFDDISDVQAICDERFALLSVDRRRFQQAISGEVFVLGLAYEITTPAVTVVDGERAANLNAAIVEIGVDFQSEKSAIMAWG